MPPFSLTIFKRITDNKTHRRMDFETWDAFKRVLLGLSEKPGYKPKKDEFVWNSSPLISPAIYEENTTRANRNVTAWAGWAALDIDEYDGTFDEALSPFKLYKHVCYSSASSKVEHPKFRVILPLTGHVSADKIKHFWFALNSELGSMGDAQTKDLSRMYYVPARYPDAFHFIFSNDDAPMIDADALMAKHPYVDPSKRPVTGILGQLPEAIRSKIAEYRRGELSNRDITWTSYADCPFVDKKQVLEYSCIQGSGWYGHVYKMMVTIAMNAIKQGYPIREDEVSRLVREIDNANGAWYENRDMDSEARRAIDYAISAL